MTENRMWRGQEWDYRGVLENFCGWQTCILPWLWLQFHRCIQMWKVIKFYTSNVCSSLYVSHTHIHIQNNTCRKDRDREYVCVKKNRKKGRNEEGAGEGRGILIASLIVFISNVCLNFKIYLNEWLLLWSVLYVGVLHMLLLFRERHCFQILKTAGCLTLSENPAKMNLCIY